MPSPDFRILAAEERDIPEMVGIITACFSYIPMEQLLGNVDTPEAKRHSSARYLRAWREHYEETGLTPGIKCVRQNPATGQEEIVACGLWFVFDKPRTVQSTHGVNYLISASWLPEEIGQRAKVQGVFEPVKEKRRKWTAGRKHAVLMYLATKPKWRRRGLGTRCVQFGLRMCEQLGAPAYLEASEQGKPVYEGLGFEKVDDVVMDFEGQEAVFPAMMWWPPGTKEEDKRPLV